MIQALDNENEQLDTLLERSSGQLESI